MFLRLQPPGKAWTRRLDSNLGKLWLADGDGMARIEETAHRLMREANPLYCVEALEDWERVLGLPDECSRPGETLDTRREAVLAKLQRPGGQSLDFFLRFLGHFGDKIVIVEGFPPFLSDVSLAGDLTWECPAGPMLDDGGELFQDFYHGWAFVWRIIRTNHRVRLFRAGRSTAGDPLALWLPNRDGESPFLECRVDKLKPAHTGVIFEYAHDDLG
ncbi:MAG: DUF2313 domain-containing protein [Deltaproteobacteria bacterium]|jgi:uncharacterized protein YmfQ (DUF2313 family)|nr:DUF2313 domain-containing protein [Deltaproteobacteria bacterium]